MVGIFALRLVRSLLVCLTLALSSVVFAPPSPAAAATSNDMLYLTNQLRYAIGAPTLTADPRVVAAAQNHANYSSANGQGGHFETAGLPYYTGYSARDRVAAMGWSTTFVSEVATGGSDPLAGVRQLWDAPYHRLGLMHPSASTLGWGHSDIGGRGTTVGDIAYDFGLRPVDFVRSPAHGQTNIPTSWSGNESPNPLPAGATRPVGYPIMVVYSGGQSVVMRGAEVVAPDGTRLPIYYAPQQFEYDYQVIIPQRPLATNTTYHVRFDITVAGTWLTNEWDFSTGASISGGARWDRNVHVRHQGPVRRRSGQRSAATGRRWGRLARGPGCRRAGGDDRQLSQPLADAVAVSDAACRSGERHAIDQLPEHRRPDLDQGPPRPGGASWREPR